LQHPNVVAHQPRLLLITPPPINEYQSDAIDQVKGYAEPQRTAENTKKYAEACRQVGRELGVAVLDLWSIMMAKTGWREGKDLPGSKKAEKSEILEKMLIDGTAPVWHLIRSDCLLKRPGLHFLPLAYKILYESLMDLICRRWPDQDPTPLTGLPFVLPVWTAAPGRP